METGVQQVSGTAITAYNRDQVDLIKRTYAKDATDDELKLFIYHAERTGLDPFSKQIHFAKHGGSMVVITGIDGFRSVAESSGKYAGNDDPIFDDDKKPTKATVTVWKIVDGTRVPFTATARWDQYYPGDKQGFMWRKMPHLMLGKCAEALALRKAFPKKLAGVYTPEELDQIDTPAPRPRAPEITTGPQIIDVPVTPATPVAKPVSAAEPTPDYSAWEAAGEWVIPFSKKYKGKKLKEVSDDELNSFASWLIQDAKKQEKPLNPQAQTFIENAEVWVNRPPLEQFEEA